MFTLQVNGWIAEAQRCPSPNFGDRPVDEMVSLLVVHNISLPPGQFGGPYIRDLFCNRLDCGAQPEFADLQGLQVSSHLLIERKGALVQFVSLHDRAWHAGVSTFRGRSNCNDYSVGIELEGSDHQPYTEAQYQTLAGVTKGLQSYYPLITTDRIVGHCDIAPGRKTDPGPAFDWNYYKSLLN